MSFSSRHSSGSRPLEYSNVTGRSNFLFGVEDDYRRASENDVHHNRFILSQYALDDSYADNPTSIVQNLFLLSYFLLGPRQRFFPLLQCCLQLNLVFPAMSSQSSCDTLSSELSGQMPNLFKYYSHKISVSNDFQALGETEEREDGLLLCLAVAEYGGALERLFSAHDEEVRAIAALGEV